MPQVISRHSLRVLTQEKDKKEKEHDLENLQKEASGDLKLEIKDDAQAKKKINQM